VIELPWKVKPAVDEELLKIYLDKLTRRSERCDNFAILLPLQILAYIQYEGINAKINELSDFSGPGMVWVEVKKIK
jgi:hypothetical protein